MTRKSEYIKFEIVDSPRKTEVWNVVSISSERVLGHILWYPQWRQYTFAPSIGTIFNPDCMYQIIEKISKLNAAHKAALRKQKEEKQNE